MALRRRALHKRSSSLPLLASAAVALLLAAFAVWQTQSSQPGTVRGVLLEVNGTGFGAPESIRLRDDSGKEWLFAVEPSVATDPEHPQNAPHLRAHLSFGDPVTVYYRQAQPAPKAYRIVD